jgi:hypothetical protein
MYNIYQAYSYARAFNNIQNGSKYED